MNRQVHRVTVLVLVMFLALAVSLTSVQGLSRPALWEASSQAGTLTSDPRNSRTVYAEFGTDRGQIIAGTQTIADSVPVDDAYAYQRTYTDSPMYAPVTGYFSTSFASMTGLERTSNSVLNGQDPALLSSRLKTLVTGGTQQGGSLELTIRPEVQQAAWDALGGRRGAVVALDPATGAILAMVSSPSYDANLLASHDAATAQTAWDTLNQDTSHPLTNRAIGGDLYAPGSTFKVLTTAAGLRSGRVSADTQVAAPDSLPLPQSTHALTNYAGESCGNGTVTLAYAFTHSCNTPFAQLAMDEGDQALAQEAAEWGIGTDLTIPLTVTPSSFPATTSAAETAMAGIGQASVRVTPLQMAMVAATVANQGRQMRPYLIAQTLDPDLNVVSTTTPTLLRTPVSKEVAGELTSLMQQVVTEGTGTKAQVAGLQVAGKTGTAETGQDTGGPTCWFIGFAGKDLDDPQIAVAVVLDGGEQTDGGTGGTVAAPVAATVIKAAVDQ